MNETTKTKAVWDARERWVLSGKGIDIGCGPDPVFPDVRKFDIDEGDANEISKYVHEEFDFVYSAHCLEHMYNPRLAILEWWKLVKPGGHLFIIVPDEDLYEQGVFPSRFNSDHKATFTMSKFRSWSPVSINVADLVKTLPSSVLVSITLQDHNYDRRLAVHGPVPQPNRIESCLIELYRLWRYRTKLSSPFLDYCLRRSILIDQTTTENALAQIQLIVRKCG